MPQLLLTVQTLPSSYESRRDAKCSVVMQNASIRLSGKGLGQWAMDDNDNGEDMAMMMTMIRAIIIIDTVRQ